MFFDVYVIKLVLGGDELVYLFVGCFCVVFNFVNKVLCEYY